MSSPPGSPSGPPMDARLQSLFYTTFRVASEGAPLQLPLQERSYSVSIALLQLPLRVPGERASFPPRHASQRGPYGERCRLQSLLHGSTRWTNPLPFSSNERHNRPPSHRPHIRSCTITSIANCLNPYPTAFPYGNGMVLHFYQQQESSTTKTVHKGLKTYV